MDAVFMKILNLSITASFLIIAVIILRQIFSKAPKWIRYILWATVALRLVIPFSFESSLSLIPNAQKIDSSSTTSTTYIAPVTQPIADSKVEQVSKSLSTMDVLSIIWIAGVAVMLIYMLVSFIRVHRLVRESVKLRDNIYICDHIGSPFVLGIIRPKIYLNSSVQEDDAKYIIAHERTHIRHFDNVFKPFGFLLLCVYWFNPLCYIAYALFVKDIELFCDESVVKTLDKDGKKNYSSVLLECGLSTKAISHCPLAFSEGNLKQRIKSVLKYKKPPMMLVVATLLVCSTVLVLFMTNPVSVDAKATQPQPTQAVTEVVTETPTQPPTDAPTQPPTEKPTEEPTEAPTEAEYVEEYYDSSYDDSYYDYYEERPFPSMVPFEPVDVYPPWAQEPSNTNTEKEPSIEAPSNIIPYEGEIVWDPNGTDISEFH